MSFFVHFVIVKITVNGLKRGCNLGHGIGEVSWKMACGIEEITFEKQLQGYVVQMEAPVAITHFISSWSSLFSAFLFFL